MKSGQEPQQSDQRKDGVLFSAVDEFGRALSRAAVAQTCQSIGFHGFHDSALESLSNILVRFLRELGKISGFYANLARRSNCNVFDVFRALEDMSSSKVPSFEIVRELMEFVSSSEDVPFAQHVARFPVVRDARMVPSFEQMGEKPNGKHIPIWLPAFPDPHTYKYTPMWNERKSDPRADKMEQTRQRRKAERSLLSLQKRLLCSGTKEQLKDALDSSDEVKEMAEHYSDPIVEKPLEAEEKDRAPVIFPRKNSMEVVMEKGISVMEAFAPAIEAAKDGIFDLEDEERKLFSATRPSVHFKVGTGKKYLGQPRSLALHSRGLVRQVPSIGPNEERDDKKKRAELILRQSAENPQELTQL